MGKTVVRQIGVKSAHEAHPGRIWVIIRHDWDNGWISLETWHDTYQEAKVARKAMIERGEEDGDDLLIECAVKRN